MQLPHQVLSAGLSVGADDLSDRPPNRDVR